MTDHLPALAHPLGGLLVAGPRLGWQYQDPAAAMAPYPHQPPAPPPPPAPYAPQPFPFKRLLTAGSLGFGISLLAGCCGFLAQGPSGATELGSKVLLFAALFAIGTAVMLGVLIWQHHTAMAQAVDAATFPQRQYQAHLSAWQQQAALHDNAEAARVSALPVWRAAGPPPGVNRLDIFGGTPTGWRDLLTVAGAGYLASHGPSTIVDFTGGQLATDLYGLCRSAGITADWQTPPADTDLLSGLDTTQLVDVLVESVHGDGDRMVRGQRATDSRILAAVTEALGEHLSLARLCDALRVLLRIPGPTPSLTADERRQIADELFPADYLTASAGTLQRLEAHLHPLRHMTRTARTAATLTIVGARNDGTTARSELLDDLILAWVTRRIATQPGQCRTLMLVGADALPGRHIERLAGICHRQGTTLIMLWQHLRDTGHTALGGGAVAFMRLRNGEEATRASDFIGRTHKFVLSGMTRTTGSSTTHTDSTGTADTVSRGGSDTFTRGGRLGDLINHAQQWTRSVGATTGTSHTSSQQTSNATGDSTSEAATTQRVYEYAIEPVVLQGLPEHAILLTGHTQHGVSIQALDCNPAIVTLPGVTMTTTMDPAAPPQPIPQQRTAPAVGHTNPAAIPSQPNPPQHQQFQQHPRAELWPGNDR